MLKEYGNATRLHSNYASLFLVFIKDYRTHRNIHQGFLASATGRSPSNWSKIENGQSILSLDTFFSVCSAIQSSPSNVMRTLEQILGELNRVGYFFQPGYLDYSEDDLLSNSLNFYSCKGLQNLVLRKEFNSLDNFFSSFTPDLRYYPDILRYLIDTDFHTWINNGAVGFKPRLAFF